MNIRDMLPRSFAILDAMEKAGTIGGHDWDLVDIAVRKTLCEKISSRTAFIERRNGAPPSRAAVHGVAWREKNPQKHAAHLAVHDARLTPLDCANCGETKTEAHHEDYGKPLEVEWLCKSCHSKLHKAA